MKKYFRLNFIFNVSKFVLRYNMIKFFNKTLILSLLSLSSFSLFAQERLPDSCLVNFYPLNIGDTWQYKLMGPVEILTTRKVIGDSLMSNGSSYKVISITYGDENTFGFERYDSLAVFCYDDRLNIEFVKYKLDEPIGGFWPTEYPGLCDTTLFGVLTNIQEKEFFGELKTEIEVDYYCATGAVFLPHDFIVKGLGLVRFGGEGDFDVLQGAIISGKQYGVITSIAEDDSPSSNVTELLSNYPNPFNSNTNIGYSIETAQEIEIAVFDILGRQVSVLYSGFRTPGVYFTGWDGTDSKGKPVASGSYVIFSKGQHFVKSRLITLLK